ncbi:uncharacterized protein LOC105801018 [Gossypium raimondii]|uniref:uncharacterized protein LOC105801018 n=1 Tax=Gossypium raimondii TaxID=29730 RepID=UPI00227C0110|nr:uncharacterized protein LOC105801018 [Gossypium raimondii]
MHVACAQKPMVEYSDEEHTVQHFTHFHPLKPVVDSTLQKHEVVCAICEKLCSSSSSTYGCTECKFFLHKSCMTSIPRQLINHLIHPCTLLFLTTPLSRCCDKCGEDIISRIEFSCQSCFIHLHVKCALLPTVDSEDAKETQHFSHPHPLALIENHKDFNNEPRCVACVETCLAPTPTFRCSRRSCNHFFLHKSCALKLPYLPADMVEPPSHPQHYLLTITSLPYNDEIRTCGACNRGFDSCLIAYSCQEDRCGFNLHLDCSKLEPSFVLDGPDHFLTLIEKVADMTCHFCGANCCNFILRCLECDINIHIQCLPSAPKTISHKAHLHPLQLTKSPLEDELNSEEEAYNSEDEFYCDVCEQKRNKRELIYFCKECRFIAEAKCVISAVLPLLTKKYIWSSEEEFSSEEEQSEEEISKEDVSDEAKSFLEIPKLHVEKILLNCIRLNERQHLLEVEMKERKAEMKERKAKMKELKAEFEKANHLLEILTEGYSDLLISLVRDDLHWRDLIICSKVSALVPESEVEDESINEIRRLHVQNVKGELMKLGETKESLEKEMMELSQELNGMKEHIRTKKHMFATLEKTHPLTFRGPLDDGQIGLDDDEQVGSDDGQFSIRSPHLRAFGSKRSKNRADFRSHTSWALPHGLDMQSYRIPRFASEIHGKHNF